MCFIIFANYNQIHAAIRVLTCDGGGKLVAFSSENASGRGVVGFIDAVKYELLSVLPITGVCSLTSNYISCFTPHDTTLQHLSFLAIAHLLYYAIPTATATPTTFGYRLAEQSPVQSMVFNSQGSVLIVGGIHTMSRPNPLP